MEFAIFPVWRVCISITHEQVNLMEHMKNSTSRDFRINTGTVQTVLQEQGSSSEDEVQEEQEPQPQEEEEEETQDESSETTAAAGEQEVGGFPSMTMKNSVLHEIFCKSLFRTSRPIVKLEF